LCVVLLTPCMLNMWPVWPPSCDCCKSSKYRV
jgi:hypothetical protein